MDIHSTTLPSSYPRTFDHSRQFQQNSSNNSSASSPPDPRTPPASIGEFSSYSEGHDYPNGPSHIQTHHQPQQQTVYPRPDYYAEPSPSYPPRGPPYVSDPITSHPQYLPPKITEPVYSIPSDQPNYSEGHSFPSSDQAMYPATRHPPVAYSQTYPQQPPRYPEAAEGGTYPPSASFDYNEGPPPLEKAPIEVIGSFWHESDPQPPFAPPPPESFTWHPPAQDSSRYPCWEGFEGSENAGEGHPQYSPHPEQSSSHEIRVLPPSQYHHGSDTQSYRPSASLSPELLTIPPPLLRPTLNGPFISHQGQHGNMVPLPTSYHLSGLPSPSANPPPLMRRFSSPLIRREERSVNRNSSSLVMPHLEMAYAVDRRPLMQPEAYNGNTTLPDHVVHSSVAITQDVANLSQSPQLDESGSRLLHPTENMVGRTDCRPLACDAVNSNAPFSRPPPMRSGHLCGSRSKSFSGSLAELSGCRDESPTRPAKSSWRDPAPVARSMGPIMHTDDAGSKETPHLRRKCHNCGITEPPSWRRSTLAQGKIVCNRCGLYERTHLRARPSGTGGELRKVTMSEGAAQRAHAQSAPYSIAPMSSKTGLPLRTRQKYTPPQPSAPMAEDVYDDQLAEDDAQYSNPSNSEEQVDFGYQDGYNFQPEFSAPVEYVGPSTHDSQYDEYPREPLEHPDPSTTFNGHPYPLEHHRDGI